MSDEDLLTLSRFGFMTVAATTGSLKELEINNSAQYGKFDQYYTHHDDLIGHHPAGEQTTAIGQCIRTDW